MIIFGRVTGCLIIFSGVLLGDFLAPGAELVPVYLLIALGSGLINETFK